MNSFKNPKNIRDVNNSCYISPTHLEFVQKDPIIHLPRPNGSAPFDDLDLLWRTFINRAVASSVVLNMELFLWMQNTERRKQDRNRSSFADFTFLNLRIFLWENIQNFKIKQEIHPILLTATYCCAQFGSILTDRGDWCFDK